MTHHEPIEVRTERLLLRRFEVEDLPSFAAYRAEPDVARFQSWDAGYSEEDAARFFAEDRQVVSLTAGRWVQLAAVDPETGVLVGDCAVHARADQPDTYEVGVTLAPASQGRGLAGEALGAVVQWLFDEHRAHRVVAECDDRNVAVVRLLERLGFRLEGRLVEADWWKGEWTTLRIYARLASDARPG